MVANRVREARRRRGWSQHQLAAIAGIPANTLSTIETGARVPRVDTALRIARALDLPVERLFWLA